MPVKKVLSRGLLLTTLLLCLVQPAASAWTTSDKKSINNNTANYERQAESTCSPVSGLETSSLPSGIPEPYNKIISAAAKQQGAHPGLLAAVFYWENRGFPDPNKNWATSDAGAQGPMQFKPATFAEYAVDWDGDGKVNRDINNIYDAIYAGAHMLAANGGKPDTPLGGLDKPLAPNTLLRVAASYNWGGGNVSSAGPNASLSNLPTETSDYLKAVFILISSNFAEKPASGSELGTITGGGQSSNPSGSLTGSCSGADTASTSVGQGSGQFIDNKNVTIPGLATALANAQKFAKMSISELGSGPCIGGPGTGCYQQCDHLAAFVWGHSSSGHESANTHWEAAVARGAAHVGDRNVPPGALVFYDTGSQYGHVATYLGNNKVLSNDIDDTHTGEGGAYIVNADRMEAAGWHATYRGWVNPVPWL